ncbi:ubiquitin carboxyl-terminal hydrolase, putative [Theileria equi strain WA]|uniref:Ubiquitin carboxyl-terminal hydrolase, putative n=1 Tax=Theileria equi strain WA TaxID=1537102 RepID=L0AZF8_THEEQ|nr:ubiquitin carboxyl-terminal hydrolase, putative [Theileria equi strain WA]AFZ80658.1 ubiquitin carboxyl-terminal hydrolase, putative [Theileria equi strain WA]|eukprot:XP_004830324.1 ubiquitin carboxyl-terminal hydrolase, putative [Theileria equi strain WA]
MLMLEVPDAPIFKDSHERNIIPQVSIFDLLKKYDGNTESYVSGKIQKYSIWRLPEYLILIVKRFFKNEYFEEKNPTIVAFPMKNLDLSEYVDEDSPEKGENARYDLVCNICHEGKPKDGSFKVFVFHPPSSNWYQLEDLLVTQVLPQFVAQSGMIYSCICS